MKQYACKKVCEKCYYCNELPKGFIDCFFGVYVDPTTSRNKEAANDIKNFHVCNEFNRRKEYTQEDSHSPE